MDKITSGEFQREFGRYRTQAHREAIVITNHGRDDLVLISADEYKRLRSLDQQALYAHELPYQTERSNQDAPTQCHHYRSSR